jgi:TrmH family RNA methyltransferase
MDHTPSPITSTRNPHIVAVRKLNQRKHRERQGQFLVEGPKLLHMALDAGARPVKVFYCPEQLAGDTAAGGNGDGERVRLGRLVRSGRTATSLLARLGHRGAIHLPVSPNVMQALSQRDVSQGMVATFALFETPLSALTLSGRELVIVLDRLQDPGNMGTLIRTADAVGAAAVILIEPCVDPFDPKTVRGSMGSLFNVPLVRTVDVAALFADLGQRGVRPIGASAHEGRVWGEGILKGGTALVLGNEARGLSEDVSAQIEAWAHLPMVGKAESLNVAVAGGVLMYAWLRANRFAGDAAPP